MLTAAETRQLARAAWRFLDHLEPFWERERGYGVESAEVLFNKIKAQIMAGMPALVACVGPSASGKSTLKDSLEVVLKTDQELRKYRRNKRVVTPIISTQWSDLIKGYSYVNNTPVEFGRLSEDTKAGVSRLGVREIGKLHDEVQRQNIPAVIIADFPGYPGNRGNEIAQYIAKNDGFVFAPWGEHHLYRMAAHLRDVARTTEDPQVLATLLEEQGIPVVGDPEQVRHQLAEECAPGFAVLDMQDQMIQLALELNDQGVLNTNSGYLPLHMDYGNNYAEAMKRDSRHHVRVMGAHVIPTLLQGWGFNSERAFVGYNKRILGVPVVTHGKLSSIK
jgi:energy-coupling factor transporter ATP-binding protein EcfA2